MTPPPYSGARRGLVLGFDVGTTFSGVSYVVLDPGEVPKIQGVTRFPAQELQMGNSKIPSILWYDKNRNLRAVGPEALLPSNLEKAEDENWIKVECWKLHLAPRGLRSDLPTDWPPPLPRGKSICDIFADFLAYLYKCAREYIQESHAGGISLWESVEDNITIILSHPNGWGGPQQAMMRLAAIQGGLVEDSEDGHARVLFVTEGEASFNFCVDNGLSFDAIKVGHHVVVIDAGGGTIDVSGYVVEVVHPLSVEEIFAPECRMHGSATVTRRAENHIAAKLRSSRFDTPEDIKHITECFDASTKRSFRDVDEVSHVKFGSPRDKDLACGIRGGMLKISGPEVASFFEPCIEAIVDAVSAHVHQLNIFTSAVLLVGGFAGSPWLFQQLQQRLGALGLSLSRPDGQTNKAVADGIIVHYLDQTVSSRVARVTYGSPCAIDFDRSDSEHLARQNTIYVTPAGISAIPGAYEVILPKGTKVAATEEFRRPFIRETSGKHQLASISAEIIAYRGDLAEPTWMDEEPHMFSKTCTVEADTSKVLKLPLRSPQGVTYYSQHFEVCLLFGLTELKAFLSWVDKGKEKRSPAKIIYNTEA